MGSKGKPLFDLNEPPAEDDEENDGVFCFQPQRAVPSSSSHTSDLFAASSSAQKIANNHAFSHASSVSGFQPFTRTKGAQGAEVSGDQKSLGDVSSKSASSKPSNGEDKYEASRLELGSGDYQLVEKEEGEWSDAEGSADSHRSNNSIHERLITRSNIVEQVKQVAEMAEDSYPGSGVESISCNPANHINDGNSNHASLGLDSFSNDRKNSSSRNSQSNCKADISKDGHEDSALVPKPREAKGAEASHALKFANSSGKRPKLDQHKEAMLGKKRSRQTMFLNLEDVKQAGAIKSSTPRRQIPAPIMTRIVKEIRPTLVPAELSGENQIQPTNKDPKQVDLSCSEGNNSVESNDLKSECNIDINSGAFARSRWLNSATDLSSEAHSSTIPKQSSLKQPADFRMHKNLQGIGRKTAVNNQNFMDSKIGVKKLPSKKQTASISQYQDTSVERLLREVTNEIFWHHPEEAELQCVPGQFESVEEYVRVFEPLLFEECRAQLKALGRN